MAVGTEHSINDDVDGETYTEDLSNLVAGDLIQVYAKTANADHGVSISNFRVYYELVPTDEAVGVNQDPS